MRGRTLGNSENHADGNPTKILDTGNSGGTLDSFSYSYNAAGSVTGESDFSGLSMSYSYNHVGELVDDSTYTYGVNEAGDPSAAGDSVSSGNELTTFVDPVSGNTLSMTYDAAGNELTKTNTYTSITWTYTYNNANQIATAVEKSGTLTMQSATYEYDPFGDLLKESVTPYVSGVAGSPTVTEYAGSPTVTEYAVDGWNPASKGAIGNSNFVTWAVLNGSGAIESRNFFGNEPNQILARIDNASNGASDASGIYFVLTDRLGSVRDVLNSTTNAAPVDVITYKAWGIMSQTGRVTWGCSAMTAMSRIRRRRTLTWSTGGTTIHSWSGGCRWTRWEFGQAIRIIFDMPPTIRRMPRIQADCKPQPAWVLG
jgi:hypothetical protein